MNNAAEQIEEQVQAAAEQLGTAVQTGKPGISLGAAIGIGCGCGIGGIGVGILADRYVFPAIKRGLDKAKVKRAERKAAKAAKKAAKKAKPAEPAKQEAPAANDGIDPTTIDTTIKD